MAGLSYMYANHIAAQDGAFEPQRQNNAILSIVGLQGDDILKLSLDGFPLPKQSNGTIETGYLNEKRKFAGVPVIEEMAVVYKDFCDMKVASVLWNWRLSVYDPRTGRIGLAKVYKKRGSVELVDPSGGHSRFYDLIGIWPSNLDPGDIDMNGEDMLKLTLTLVCDKCIPGNGLLTDGGMAGSYSNFRSGEGIAQAVQSFGYGV